MQSRHKRSEHGGWEIVIEVKAVADGSKTGEVPVLEKTVDAGGRIDRH
jgi:hypothetical protein